MIAKAQAATVEPSTAKHIGALAILVREYDEAIALFTQKLGFYVKEDSLLPNGERWVGLGPIGATTMLQLARATRAEQIAQVGNQAGGRVICYLHTKTLREIMQRCLPVASISQRSRESGSCFVCLVRMEQSLKFTEVTVTLMKGKRSPACPCLSQNEMKLLGALIVLRLCID